jgi:hypothetical protein
MEINSANTELSNQDRKYFRLRHYGKKAVEEPCSEQEAKTFYEVMKDAIKVIDKTVRR